MISQEITDDITPFILYLKDCAYNTTLHTLLLMLTYDTSASLHHM